MSARLLVAALFVVSAPFVLSLNNGLARIPQMGWNSWNHFNCNLNETLIRQTADLLVSTGLSKAGYNFVNMDDCWAFSRDASGNIQPQPDTFPSGIKALADYVHSKGLKFGLYSDAGLKTCAGRPGSLGFEVNDANTYASWGVDYLKYDNCYDNGTAPEVRYPVMRNALNATGRDILFSMCEWGVDNPATWAPAVGNSWRTTGDISDNWDSMMTNILYNDLWYKYAAPGGWNDPDMLEVGNGGMSTSEYRVHFSLWCITKAPLLIGCDISNMTQDTVDILTAPELIAVNQDPLGVQGHRVASSAGLDVWAGPLSDNSIAVALVNTNTAAATITADFSDIGLTTNTGAVRDLWKQQDVGVFMNSYSAFVPPHDVVVVKVSPVNRV